LITELLVVSVSLVLSQTLAYTVRKYRYKASASRGVTHYTCPQRVGQTELTCVPG